MPLPISCPHAATRRELLLGSGALFAWAFVPKIARAEDRDPRFLTIVLRGALDGLAAVAPVGDPDWVKLRGDNALKLDGATPALPLDGFFALNPAMPNLHRLYKAGQAIVVHAVATPYRERSHFDGQDVLESGLARPGTWVPPRLPPVSDDTTARLLDLYRHADPKLARVLEDRIDLASLAPAGSPDRKPSETGPVVQVGNINQVRAYFAEAAGAAAKFLANPDGPRVGALALDGWDTHVNEGLVNGRLAQLLGALDTALGAVETNMGAAWGETVVTLITEFGRTARVNGTAGTDHGTATVALLVGGALKGGRVVADWPGVKEADLYEKRDLKATADLRAVLKGLLRDHLRADERVLTADIFPGSDAVAPMAGLLA